MLSALALALGLQQATNPKPPAPPGVVLFYVDDLGWRDTGFAGSGYYRTPELDRLAAEGMVFTQAYSDGPNCAPSRASLMSGRWPARHGVYTVNSSARGKAEDRALVPIENRLDLDEGFVTLAETLAAGGYRTGLVGKWHLGDDPTTQGFEFNAGGIAKGSPPGGYFPPYRNPALEDGPEDEYLTERLTREAVAFLRAHREEPFFLFLSHYAVHTPIQAPAEDRKRFEGIPSEGGHDDPRYAAMIAAVDASLGAIRAELEALGRSDTLIVFTSDNGGHGRITSMAPLRGSKGMLYEGGIRVPLVVHWPGHTRAGQRSAEPVSGLDLYPTVLEVCGLTAPGPLDGRSLVPLLEKRADALGREALFWHFPAYLEAYGGGAGPWRTTPVGAVRAGRHKLLEFFEDGRLELYDLAADPGEARDLAADRPQLRDELHGLLRTWRADTGAAVPRERNPAFRPR